MPQNRVKYGHFANKYFSTKRMDVVKLSCFSVGKILMKRTTVCHCNLGVVRNRVRLAAFIATGTVLSLYSFTPRASALGIYTLGPGQNILANPSAFPVGGTVLDTVIAPFTSSTIDGTVISQVISGDSSNPYHGLTFTYSLSLNNFSSDSSSEMTIGSYGGFVTDVSYNLTDSEVVPSNFTRSTTQNGSVIRFMWSNGGGIAPGQEGALIVVQTAAPNFTSALGGVIDSQTVNISTLAPVPEPGVASLLITGLGVFAVWRRQSK
jgi:hypothetical protein